MKDILSLPNLPEFKLNSPKVVQTLDKIRMDIVNQSKNDDLDEFCWFVREYPRVYRHHLDCAEYRLKSIYNVYLQARIYFEENLDRDSGCFEMVYSDKSISAMYWDFESFLSAINISLDILARIVGTAYVDQTPVSFNKLCKKDLDGMVNDLVNARKVWVSRLKDYRDCFTHYTCVDTLLGITARLYSDGWEIRAKLPTNPNSRDMLLFKYSRRVELLRYAISSYKHMAALDKVVARRISRLYEMGEFPKRTTNLFFLGKR